MSIIRDERLHLKREYLIKLRAKFNISQNKFAEFLGYARQDWDKYEKGQNHWSIERCIQNFDKISEYYGISTSVLLEAESSYQRQLAELKKSLDNDVSQNK